MNRQYSLKNTCRICGGKKFQEILNLGKSPLANAFLSKDELSKPEPRFPLVVYFCEHCSLVGLRHVVEPNLLFKNYHYLTSASAPLSEHFKALAVEVGARYINSKNDLVVEIGSNDGNLLSNLKNQCRVLGVDPADNVTALASKRGIETLTAFFTEKTAEEIVKKYGQAKVILANNVIAHIDNLSSVFGGIRKLLGPNGVFIFEVHWVGNLITEGGFDQVYHEHLSYFSLGALKYILKKFGLTAIDAKLVPIHGESLRVYAAKTGEASLAVSALQKKEKRMGLGTLATFKRFGQKVANNKNKLGKLLKELKKAGKKITGYGAPAKGNTLLNYVGIDASTLDYITDTTSLKQGLYTPGVHIPIVAPEVLLTKTPDFILLLSWNYETEILKKEKALRGKGVKFIIPVPEVRIV